MADTTKKFRAAALALLAVLVLSTVGVAVDKDGEKEIPSVGYVIKDKSVLAIESNGNTRWETKLRYPPDKVEKIGDYLLAWGEREVVCLSEANGRICWTVAAKGPKKLKLDGEKLYIRLADQLCRVNAADGKVEWRYYVGGEKIVVFEIFGGDRVYVLTDKRAAFVEVERGKAIVTEFLRGRKLKKASRYGSILLLEFGEEAIYYDAASGKKIATKKMSDFAEWKTKKPAEALDDIVALLGASSNQLKAAALVDLRFTRTKAGDPWMVELVVSKDEDIQAKVPDLMEKFAAITLDKSAEVAGTADAVLKELASADTTGKFETAYVTAVMTIAPDEVPNPRYLLFGLIKMLVLGDAKMRARTIETLKELTGENFGFKPDGTFEERREAVAKWEKWYRENASRFAWDIAKRKIIITKNNNNKKKGPW